MRLLRADRMEPKRAFRCVRCDPPPKKARVRRRYLFELGDENGQSGSYCLPCAAKLLSRTQGALRREADSQPEVRYDQR